MSDDFCNICGVDPHKGFTRFYAHNPFVDCRNYNLICWACACVPQTEYEDENGQFIILRHLDSERLNTVESMMQDGFSRHDAERSVKAVRKLVKSIKFSCEPSDTVHIFGQLIFGDSIEMPLTI